MHGRRGGCCTSKKTCWIKSVRGACCGKAGSTLVQRRTQKNSSERCVRSTSYMKQTLVPCGRNRRFGCTYSCVFCKVVPVVTILSRNIRANTTSFSSAWDLRTGREQSETGKSNSLCFEPWEPEFLVRQFIS